MVEEKPCSQAFAEYFKATREIKCEKKPLKIFEQIRDWARERGLYDKGDVNTQYVKLQEEAGELAKALPEIENVVAFQKKRAQLCHHKGKGLMEVRKEGLRRKGRRSK